MDVDTDGLAVQRVPAPLWRSKITTASAAFTDDETAVVLRGSEEITILDAATGQPKYHPVKLSDLPSADVLSINKDGSLLLLRSASKVFQWSMAQGKIVGPTIRLENKPERALYSPDQTRILAVTNWRIVQVDAQTGLRSWQEITIGNSRRDYFQDAQYSPDGKRIITQALSATRLYDADTAVPLGKPINFSHTLSEIIFSQVADRVILRSLEEMGIWETVDGHQIGQTRTVPQANNGVLGPDGKTVIIQTKSPTAAYIYDVATNTLLGRVAYLTAQNDGRDVRLLGASPDGTIWDVEGSKLMAVDQSTGVGLGKPVRLDIELDRPVARLNHAGTELLIKVKQAWELRKVVQRLPPLEDRVGYAFLSLIEPPSPKFRMDQSVRQTERFEQIDGSDACGRIANPWESQNVPRLRVAAQLWIPIYATKCRAEVNKGDASPGDHYQLGRLYLLSNEPADAKLEFEKAANGGVALANIGLGVIAETTIATSEGRDEAWRLYEKAKSNGASEAADFFIGNLRWALAKNVEGQLAAVETWQRSAKAGNPFALAHLAELSEVGVPGVVAVDLVDALDKWSAASAVFAALGDADSDEARYARSRKATLVRHLFSVGERAKLRDVWLRAQQRMQNGMPSDPGFISRVGKEALGSRTRTLIH